jgi:hypothetical protein
MATLEIYTHARASSFATTDPTARMDSSTPSQILGDIKCAAEIGFDDLDPVLQPHLFDGSAPGGARIVDEDVDAADHREGSVDDGMDVGGILYIAADRESLHTKLFQFFAVRTQRSFFLVQRTILAPISARASAVWRPSPAEPPVMMAVRPGKVEEVLYGSHGARQRGTPRDGSYYTGGGG